MSNGIVFLFLTILPRFAVGIIGGMSPKNWRAYPGIVLIDNVFDDPNRPPFCTGVLIHPQFILTNGLCCFGSSDVTRIYVGSTTPFDRAQVFRMARHKHVGNAKSSNYQICVMKLHREVQFNADCFPLALPSAVDDVHDDDVQRQQSLISYGFGSVYWRPPNPKSKNYLHHRFMSDELMAIDIPLLSNEHCEAYLGEPNVNNIRLLCMGFAPEDLGYKQNHTLMLDDNGAPMVGSRDHVVYGIVSTYAKLKQGLNRDTNIYPYYVSDVGSVKEQILLEMSTMMKLKEDW